MEVFDINIKLRNEPLYHYGQKLYVISRDYYSTKTYNSPCPICDDEKTIEYKGMKFKCPMCQAGGYENPNSISLQKVTVEEIIVNQVSIIGPEYKKSYTYDKKFNDYPRVNFKAFLKKGSGYGSVRIIDLPGYDMYIDPEPDEYFKLLDKESVVFFSKSKADQIAKQEVEREKERLRKFNELHGTNHQYPFD